MAILTGVPTISECCCINPHVRKNNTRKTSALSAYMVPAQPDYGTRCCNAWHRDYLRLLFQHISNNVLSWKHRDGHSFPSHTWRWVNSRHIHVHRLQIHFFGLHYRRSSLYHAMVYNISQLSRWIHFRKCVFLSMGDTSICRFINFYCHFYQK